VVTEPGRLSLELDDAALEALAELIVPRLAGRIGSEQPAQRWLDVGGAADYLRCPRSRVYALVSAGRIPVHRDGSRLLFDRPELDEWVRAGGAKRP
jgi:excisionase family DNA binding protein